MRKFAAAIAGFVGINVAATVIAVAYRPLIGPMLGIFARTDQEGLNFPSLLSGYLIISLMTGWFVGHVRTELGGWRHGALVGTALGLAIFLGDHLVTAGWSRIPAAPMLMSGIADILAVTICGALIAAIRREPCSEP